MSNSAIESAVSTVPSGPWAVGVSGGADSVALLLALRAREDLELHVAHLDHQTRGPASTGDARFVEQLAREWSLPCTSATREQIEPSLKDLPANPSARYRALRLELFRRVVETHRLVGVILAHHADDQAETVFQRLIRGSSYVGLAGMRRQTVIRGLTILRPLLSLRRDVLRDWLTAQGQTWREDASNESDVYLRNRLRRIIGESSELFDSMIELSRACAALRDWARSCAPSPGDRIISGEINRLPRLLADESLRRWLIDRGVPADQIDAASLDRLLLMINDAATPARQEFAGGITLRRRAGTVFVDPQS